MVIKYKSDYLFYSYQDKRLKFDGSWEDVGDAMVSIDEKASFVWQGVCQDFLIVWKNHDWSGICEVDCNGYKQQYDNYSSFPWLRVIPVSENQESVKVEVKASVIGKNQESNSCQMVIFGFLAKGLDDSETSTEPHKFGDATEAKQKRIHESIYRLFHKNADVSAMVANRQNDFMKLWQKVANQVGFGAKVLDIGSGYNFSSLLNLFRDKKWDYYYIDRNFHLVEANKKANKSSGVLSKNFVFAKTYEFSFETNSFDCVVSWHHLDKLDNLENKIRDIYKILKSGGFFFLTTSLGLKIDSDEYLYFLGVDEWQDILRLSGLNILSLDLDSNGGLIVCRK